MYIYRILCFVLMKSRTLHKQMLKYPNTQKKITHTPDWLNLKSHIEKKPKIATLEMAQKLCKSALTAIH